MSEKKQEQNINIELSEEVANGQYSNLAIINHSPTEFVLDFVNLMPGVPKAKVQSRMIMTPIHAKRLLNALHNNISNFEKANGTIQEPEQPMAMPFNLGPQGEA